MSDDINLPDLISHLQVNLADTNGIVEDAARQGSSVGAALGQSMQAEVRDAVDNIPPVRLDSNSTQLDRDLEDVRRRLQRIADTRIGVDISIDEALRRMAELEPHLERLSTTHPDIQVRASVSAARYALADMQEAANRLDGDDVDIAVQVDTGRADEDVNGVSRALSGVLTALRSVGGSAASLGKIGALAGSAIPAVAGLVSFLEQIAPAAALGVTAVLGVVSAVAAVKVGTSGVGDAIKAAFAPASGGGGSAASSAAAGTNAVADAQRNLKDAVQQAAQAAAQAARQVGDAERDLADAQKAALDAQKALTAAREEATRQLQDENNQLADAKLAERQAVLDVEDAEKNLAAVRAQGAAASQEDQEKAQLQYDKAVQALKEQQLQTARLQSDTDAANKAGVEGSQTVQDAQQKVADAARDVSDRQRDLADAQANVKQTAYQSAEAIDRAREALEQAGQAAGASGAAGGVDAFAEAMAKLSPSARAFVQEIIRLRPSLDALKLDVQEHLFAGWADEVDRSASVLLPIFRRSLDESADTLNQMGKGVSSAARDIGRDGILGRALDGANAGLRSLAGVPGLVVKAVGQIGAAAAPAFDRVTAKAADTAKKVSDKLNAGFQSGGLERAIDTAVATLGELGHVGANVLTIVSHILNPAHATGGGLIGILSQVTDALAKATATRGFQDALTALFGVMGELGRTLAPLVVTALAALEPVLTHLGPPATRLVDALGAALAPILDALAPLLVTAADAVGALTDAALPLLPVASKIIASLGPALQPILAGLVQLFEDCAPAVAQLADDLSLALSPILAQLPKLIGPLVDLLVNELAYGLQLLTVLLAQNAPAFAQLGVSFSQLLVAAGPLITQLSLLSTKILIGLTPLLLLVTSAVTQLATSLSKELASVINGLVIPVLKTLTDLLEGKFGAAWEEARSHAGSAIKGILLIVTGLPGQVATALAPLAGRVGSAAVTAANRLTAPISSGVSDAVSTIGGLPGRAVKGLGDLSKTLLSAGSRLIGGFIDGIKSRLGDVKSTLGSLTGQLTDWKGPPSLDAVLLTPAGRSLIQGFMDGIDAQVPALRAQLQGLTGQLPGWGTVAAALPSAGALAASYAGSAAPAQGPVTINMYGTEATPAGVASALSWQSKVGRR